ncbi:MAG: PKD domain-containing protein [Thermoplasmata archaeon]|nr:MAG: PKD domain-containing protein [Thermoplasmata archaeon]
MAFILSISPLSITREIQEVMKGKLTVLNTPPVADFSWTPIKPTDVENVTFYSLAYDIDGSIVNYTWNLGDGSIKYGQNVSHKYVDNGNYTVNLTIRDDDGAVVWIEKNIAVFNVPPFVNFSWYPSEIYTFEVVHFSEFSYDIDGSVVNYTWDFGDGNISYEKNPQHWYADNGMYTVILTVRDDDGAITSMEKQIVILNNPPVADFSWTPTKPTDIQEITFNASLSYDSDGNIVNYTWDFESDGIIDAYGIEVIHIYDDNGTYTITLNIEDDDGATDSITKEITVLNVPPIADFEYSVKGHPEKEPTDLDIIEFKDNSVDPDGSIVNYTWDFGDGNISYEKNPQHQYKEDGVYTITLTIVDNDGDEKSVSKAILIKNVPPVAQFTFTPEEPTDLETVHFNANSSYDEDGEIVNYTWNFGNGNYSYGIATNYSYGDDGIYTVILTVKDDDGTTAVISKRVEVINVKPTALFEYEPAKPRENEKIIFNASLSHDPDGSIVSYEWDFESDGIIDAYGVETEYKYKKKGSYEITLTVKDDDGEEDTYHMIIDIKEKERIPGFELSIIIIASAILIFMKRYRRGIWRM